ncbi:MAG: TraX family protein [Oscillospiraceae bacterium]|nr:TraX family protein [Oscillospiraceae bacterium]
MHNALAESGTTSKLNGNQLKLIAILAMTIDHLAWTFYPGYQTGAIPIIMHLMGRLTAPIMWYFVAEGFFYTKNLKKYIMRMFLFAIVSHFAYALMFQKDLIPFQNDIFDQTSVMWALAWVLVALSIEKSENLKLKPWMKNLAMLLIWIITFCADWSSIAVLAIVHIGKYRGNFKRQMTGMVLYVVIYATVYALFLNPLYGLMQMAVALSIPVLYLYNGEKGKWKGMKWLFYIYYPAHLTILGLVRIFILSSN